ncbi:MAG: NUDIX hydrolase [Coriobacteriia bacterium]|nr:NUDIX hydrolase [Coriobacteriia bacterium]
MVARASSGPRVRVAALMTFAGKVVLVRHRRGARTYHLLPGGGVNRGESLADALMREVAEETGLHCSVGRPLIINDTIDPNGNRHIINITFDAHVTGGSITDTPEDDRVESVDLRNPAELGSLDLRPPIAALVFEALRNPSGFSTVYAGSLFAPEIPEPPAEL